MRPQSSDCGNPFSVDSSVLQTPSFNEAAVIRLRKCRDTLSRARARLASMRPQSSDCGNRPPLRVIEDGPDASMRPQSSDCGNSVVGDGLGL